MPTATQAALLTPIEDGDRESFMKPQQDNCPPLWMAQVSEPPADTNSALVIPVAWTGRDEYSAVP
jgi:hypothetical protein